MGRCPRSRERSDCLCNGQDDLGGCGGGDLRSAPPTRSARVPGRSSVGSSVSRRIFENTFPPRLEPRYASSGSARVRAGSTPATSTGRRNRANLDEAPGYARCLVSFMDEVCRFVCRLGRSRRWKWTPKETGKRTSQRRPVKRSRTTSTTRGLAEVPPVAVPLPMLDPEPSVVPGVGAS